MQNFVVNYDWVLFDVDETLFHFDSFTGLKILFSQYSIEFTDADYIEYQNINQSLWIKYQQGQISASELKSRRFLNWSNRLNIDPDLLNTHFLQIMVQVSTPIKGAIELLTDLKGKTKLGIITNGFVRLLHERLEYTGLKNYFDLLVISEEVGLAKPNREIFDYAYQQIGNISRNKILMVGDNPDADIIGGLNAGFDTCWFNPGSKLEPTQIIPKFEVSSLSEIKPIVLGS